MDKLNVVILSLRYQKRETCDAESSQYLGKYLGQYIGTISAVAFIV
jgi:cadmium resistance protein CadD (predicted permease)